MTPEERAVLDECVKALREAERWFAGIEPLFRDLYAKDDDRFSVLGGWKRVRDSARTALAKVQP